jgi:hypothetical protein
MSLPYPPTVRYFVYFAAALGLACMLSAMARAEDKSVLNSRLAMSSGETSCSAR